jgi:putative peptide zinc metalloprotease protein
MWMFVYAIASFIMRVAVSISIMFYLGTVLEGALIILATAMAIIGIVTWALVPMGKFLHYLTTNQELSRVRSRAIWTTVATVAVVVGALGFIPIPDRTRAEGVVEPLVMKELFAKGDGFVQSLSLGGRREFGMPDVEGAGKVGGSQFRVNEGDTILVADNHELRRELKSFQAERDRLAIEYDRQFSRDPASALLVQSEIEKNRGQIEDVERRLRDLEFKAPQGGILIAPELESRRYAFIKALDRLGIVADTKHLIVRAATPNELAGQLRENVNDTWEVSRRVEIRVNGRPDILLTGRITVIDQAGRTELPAASLGYQVGGAINTAPEDQDGRKTMENIFEVRVDDLKVVKAPKEVIARLGKDELPLLIGQRVVVRFDLTPKPIAVQVWKSFRQLFLKKFKL